MKASLKVVQVKSPIGRPESQRITLKALGLTGIGTQVVVKNTPSFRGAIKKVMHLITVEEV